MAKALDIEAGISEDLSKIAEIRASLSPDQKIVFIAGILNVVHSGHLRLFNFAAECGDVVVVGLFPSDHSGAVVDEHLRLEAAQSLSVIKHAFIMENPLNVILEHLKPDVVVKGKEHENSGNPERETIESYGGKLLFGSSDSRFSTAELLQSEHNGLLLNTIEKPEGYHQRHGFSLDSLTTVIRKFSKLNVTIIGDLIVDEYINCEPQGMSQEDPTLVVSPINSQSYLGGAGIVAAHASGLGAQANFFTIAGGDNAAAFATQKLEEYGVNHNIIYDDTRPTTQKKRYRALEKTLLRVNEMRKHDITKELSGQILAQIKAKLEGSDLLIFSDFNYGCLPQGLVDDICDFCRRENIMMVADSQASSQFGDVSRFKGMHMVTPTEREARLAVRDFSTGLVELATKLQNIAKAENVIMTLGSEGLLIQNTPASDKDLRTDRLKAMNSAPKDVAGGGDSVLVSSAMALAAGASIWQAAYIASLAAAFQVGRIGNVPLSAQELIEEINR